MNTVTSADGTRIAYQVDGRGPPLVLVDGAFGHRGFGPGEKLAALLTDRFRVVRYDRRGRGDSGDTAPFAVDREIEDLQAVAAALDDKPFLYGTSSGAALALRAVAAGLPVRGLVAHEPPFSLDGTRQPSPLDFRERIEGLVRDNKRSDAAKLFLRVVGTPAVIVFVMSHVRSVWGQLERNAHTLRYDFAALGETQLGGPLPDDWRAALPRVQVPTLLLVGGKSPPYLHHAVEVVAKQVAGARVQVLPKQTHAVDPRAVAPALTSFFA